MQGGPGSYTFGDIVLVSAPFTDGSKTKPRPAIVICEDRQDSLIIKLTSNEKQVNAHAYLIKPDTYNNLHEPSVIEIGKQFLIHKSSILGRIGALSHASREELRQKLHEFVDSI